MDGQYRLCRPEDAADQFDHCNLGDLASEEFFLSVIQADEPAHVNLQVDRIRWLVITHGVFVLSGTMFAVMDWIGARTERTRKEDGICLIHDAPSIHDVPIRDAPSIKI